MQKQVGLKLGRTNPKAKAHNGAIASIAVYPLDTPLSYAIPSEIDAQSLIGSRVEVPLTRRFAEGFVVGLEADSEIEREYAVKSIKSEGTITRCFTSEQLEFFKWISTYYQEPLSHILDLALPRIPPTIYETWVTLSPSAESKIASEKIRGAAQLKLLEILKQSKGRVSLSTLRSQVKGASNVVKKLAQLAIISTSKLEAEYEIPEGNQNFKDDLCLSEAQQIASDKVKECIDQKEFKSFLLMGVTGSGKTEVYIDVVAKALKHNKGALIVVPEIALTPQLIDRFRSRLGASLAILHSGLSARERWQHWQALLNGNVQVAIGARSALFAPIKNLGVIIVDEEHDSSFKQSDGVRYHARDLAIVRAKLSGIPVMLGSATPSIETYHQATRGKYNLLRLPQRYSTIVPPTHELVDLTKIKPWELSSRSVSAELYSALEEVLAKKEQAFLLYNRRGFASYLQCLHCEHVLACPNCSVTLTYYRRRHALLCHYCGHSSAPPVVCPECNKHGLPPDYPKEKTTGPESPFEERGGGTERIFEEIQELFPDARIARLDRDAASSMEEYTRILASLRNGELDIIVGTQLIAKGHDIPNVTLVGVLDCDIGLHMPDFRASERVFQLLTQAAGRAGRHSKQGLAIFQTRVPKHPSIIRTISKDYEAFAADELKVREAMNYPPFTFLLRIIVASTERSLCKVKASEISATTKQLLLNSKASIDVLGPAPAPIEKLRNHWRWHLLVKGKKFSEIHKLLAELRVRFSSDRKIRISYDFDPYDMM